MAKKQQPATDQPPEEVPTESPATAAAEQPAESEAPANDESDMLNELREAYEQARTELKQTSDKLRSELKKIDIEEAGEKAKTWVKENPGLAFFLAVGAGMLVGRAITKAVEPPPPPRLTDRVRDKSSYLADSARQLAGDTMDRLSTQAAVTGEQMADRVRSGVHSAKGAALEQAGVLGEVVNRRAGELGATAAEKTDELISSFSDAAERAADSLQVAARDLSKSMRKHKRAPKNFIEAVMHTAKTVVGAFVFKRLSDWLRERY